MSDAPPAAAVSRDIFCRDCFYNLRGLETFRCPECGRFFDPRDPRTYSFTPHPDRLGNLAKLAADILAPLAPGTSQPSPSAPRRPANPPSLEQWARHLQQENVALWRSIRLLVDVLVEKKLLRPDEAEELRWRSCGTLYGPPTPGEGGAGEAPRDAVDDLALRWLVSEDLADDGGNGGKDPPTPPPGPNEP
jgi:hypothetical protein